MRGDQVKLRGWNWDRTGLPEETEPVNTCLLFPPASVAEKKRVKDKLQLSASQNKVYTIYGEAQIKEVKSEV